MRSFMIACLGCILILISHSTAVGSGTCRIPLHDSAVSFELSFYQFLNQNYEPVLYWGISASGEVPLRNVKCFYARYPDNVPINEKFTIEALEIVFGGRVMKIAGSCLTEDLQQKIYEASRGQVLHCTALIKNERGVSHRLSGKWLLN